MSKRTGAGAYSCHFTPSIASGMCMCNACMNIDFSDSLVAEDSVEANSSNNQLSSFYLISEAFSSHTKKIVEASGGETLYYYLESESTTRKLANGMTLETYGHSLDDENYIEDLFLTLDPLIDLDFERTYDYSISSFDFYSVWDVWDWNDSTLGQVNDQLDNAYYWDVIWKDAEGSEETSPLDKFIIAHELGHGVHQFLANRNGVLLADTPLTLAETASVFGEMLTFKSLLNSAKDISERKLLLRSKIEDMLNTVFRQI